LYLFDKNIYFIKFLVIKCTPLRHCDHYHFSIINHNYIISTHIRMDMTCYVKSVKYSNVILLLNINIIHIQVKLI